MRKTVKMRTRIMQIRHPREENESHPLIAQATHAQGHAHGQTLKITKLKSSVTRGKRRKWSWAGQHRSPEVVFLQGAVVNSHLRAGNPWLATSATRVATKLLTVPRRAERRSCITKLDAEAAISWWLDASLTQYQVWLSHLSFPCSWGCQLCIHVQYPSYVSVPRIGLAVLGIHLWSMDAQTLCTWMKELN